MSAIAYIPLQPEPNRLIYCHFRSVLNPAVNNLANLRSLEMAHSWPNPFCRHSLDRESQGKRGIYVSAAWPSGTEKQACGYRQVAIVRTRSGVGSEHGLPS